MRGVPEQGAQDDHQLHTELVREAEQFVAERAPAHGRFDTAYEHQVRGFSPPTRTTDNLVVGHVILRTPPSMNTVGRFTWKS